ncbi:hypothetical protein BHE74_00040966 [Ensete ventricosum]|nr:hypothetical protein BHE74_00040966 [Ensete ventricosum]
MSDLPEVEVGGLSKARWSNLPPSTWLWASELVTTEFMKGALHLTITRQLYGAPSKELVDQAAKDAKQYCKDLERTANHSHRELKDLRDSQRNLEDEVLKLTETPRPYDLSCSRREPR